MLSDTNIRLRALEKIDLMTLYEWENLSQYWPASATLAPYSHHNLMRYLEEYEADPYRTGQLRLMIERIDDTEPLGLVDLYNVEVRHRRACVGILIGPHQQRHGYALAALRLLEDYCRRHLTLHQLLAAVPRYNNASTGLFHKAGYQHIATLTDYLAGSREGEYQDAMIFSLIL
ncbi:MAG: GNAT family N-acetyltransferase [Muribaculaceae bacterium]|nr:GNAT family N-acetyltransferase [Muribaculaceae bacterium]